eukprot:3792895-Rhodomonas_salina.1
MGKKDLVVGDELDGRRIDPRGLDNSRLERSQKLELLLGLHVVRKQLVAQCVRMSVPAAVPRGA